MLYTITYDIVGIVLTINNVFELISKPYDVNKRFSSLAKGDQLQTFVITKNELTYIPYNFGMQN